MANETAGPAAACTEVSGFFDQAFRAYGESLKMAMKLQEDTVRMWSETVARISPLPAFSSEWVPTAQKYTDECSVKKKLCKCTKKLSIARHLSPR